MAVAESTAAALMIDRIAKTLGCADDIQIQKTLFARKDGS